MSFDDEFPHQTLFELFGQAATFDSPGKTVSTLAVVDRDVALQPGAFDSQIAENQTVISLLVADIGEPVRGDTVTIGSDVHTVDAVASNDGYVVRVVVK